MRYVGSHELRPDELDDGPVVVARRRERRVRRLGRLLERQRRRHLRGDDDACGRADEARVDVGAVQRERPDEPQRLRVRDVDLREHRLRGEVRHRDRRRGGTGRQPVPTPREHEQPVACEQELVAPAAVELQRVEQPRSRLGDVDGVEPAARDGEQGRAVRLDEIRLVDALLLDVGAGVVDALRPRRGAGRRDGDAGRQASSDERGAAEAPRADERRRLRLDVAEQVAAGAERHEPRGLRGGGRAGVAGGRVTSRPVQARGGEHERRRDKRHPPRESHALVIDGRGRTLLRSVLSGDAPDGSRARRRAARGGLRRRQGGGDPALALRLRPECAARLP